MAITAYDLPTVASVVGDFKIRVYSSDATLTAPTVDTILEIGDRTETINQTAGVAEVSTLTLTVRDDYSNDAEGFWYAALASSECYIRILLTETTDKTYFVGTPQLEATNWDTASLYGGSFIRIGHIMLVDLSVKMLETNMGNWIDNDLLARAFANTASKGSGETIAPVKINEILSSLLYYSGLNAAYSAGDTTWVFDASNPNYKFKWTGGSFDQTFDDLAVPCYVNGNIGTIWNNAQSDYFGTAFGTAADFVAALLRGVAVIRMGYDASTETASALGTSSIQLIQNTRAYADAVNLAFSNREKGENVGRSSELLIDAVRFTRMIANAAAPTNFFWYDTEFAPDGLPEGGWFSGFDPDDKNVQFDIDEKSLFTVDDNDLWTTDSERCRVWWVYDSGAAIWKKVVGVQHYSFATSAYVTAITSTVMLEEALGGYIFHRFSDSYSRITRLYGHMTAGRDDSATELFTNLTIGRRTSINDGTGAVNYYANKVTLKPSSAEVEIEWFKE